MQVIWSNLAKTKLKEIYLYYKKVAGIEIAKPIKNRILNKPLQLSKNPEIGQEEENPNVSNMGFRYLVEGNFKIVYKVYHVENVILIATVFDTRQNPATLKV
jgi:plasmid stabilization system protein ParE